MREIWIVVLGILGLISVGAESATTLSRQLVAEAKPALQISQDDRVLGNPNAPITIVEYASLGCRHCDADLFHQWQQIQRRAHCGRVQQSPVEPSGEVVKPSWPGRLPP